MRTTLILACVAACVLVKVTVGWSSGYFQTVPLWFRFTNDTLGLVTGSLIALAVMQMRRKRMVREIAAEVAQQQARNSVVRTAIYAQDEGTLWNSRN